MKCLKVNLASLSIVVAICSAFTTVQIKLVENYKIYSAAPGLLSASTSYSSIIFNGTQIANLGTVSQNLSTYNSNNNIECLPDVGILCDAEVRTDNATVFQIIEGDPIYR
jgi:hypothetical protein